MNNNINNDISQICRTCMNEIADMSFFYLDCTQAANTQLTIKQKLHSCIPELDLSIVSNAVMCNKCADNLQSVYEFKKNCLQSEIQINKYIQQIQHTDDLDLVAVVFHQPDIKNLDTKVKLEDFEHEDLVYETSAFNEARECTESIEPKYLLKLEKVDTQYAFFNTFDDYNINYNLSVAEENSSTTHNSNISQNFLPEVTEHQDNYSKNLNKSNAYYVCYKCGHKAKSKLKLISHLKYHTQENYHRKVISKTLSRYHKNLLCYYRCSLCNYLTKYKCLFGFHNRIHLTKKNFKHIFKYPDIHTKGFSSTIKLSKINIKGNKTKCIKNCNKYDKHSFKNQNKSKNSEQNFGHDNLKLNMTAQKSFICSICEYQCKSKGHLKRHKQCHTEGKPFSCSVCKYQCSKKGDLKRHIRNHTGEKPFSCAVCNYQFSRKADLKRHIQIHTGEKPFWCAVCKYQFRQKSDLKRHILIHTGEKPFSCSACKYQCRQKNDLTQHIRTHTSEKPFSCSVCTYQPNRKSDLNQHMLIHTGAKPFSCSVCTYQPNRRSDLNRHMLIHTGAKPFSCSICKFQCSWKSMLKQHMLIHTGEIPEKQFSCSVCEYRSSLRAGLKQHMRIHTGEKPFSCSFCKYQCSQKVHLKQHIVIHTGGKPFSCSICKYQALQKSEFKQHLQIHTGEKPFSCSICTYQSNRKSDLNRHMLIHTGAKPFSCSFCKYQCRQKSQLNQHMGIHIGEKLFM